MEIKRIEKTNVSAQVYDQLLRMISEGAWKPGDRIPSEHELADSFGVSRVTIRQALQKLSALGLVETRLGEGSYIRELSMGVYMNQLLPAIYLSEDSIRQVLEFRMMIEVETVAVATRKATNADIIKLRECYAKMLEAKDNLEECVYLDFHFHRLIMSISGNQVVVQVHYLLREVLQGTMATITRGAGNRSGIKYHKLIIEAMESKDEDAARRYMKEHLIETLELYEMVLLHKEV